MSASDLPCRRKPGLRDFVLRLHDHDAGILRPVHAAEFREQILFVRRRVSVHQDYGLGAMISRVDRLGDQLRQCCVSPALPLFAAKPAGS